MSIADKLLIVAENVQKVYEAGRKAGGDYDTAYNEGYDKGYTEGETAGYSTGYTEGKNSVPNPFEYANTINAVFQTATFPENYEIELVVPNPISIRYVFNGATGLKKITLKGNNNSNVLDFGYAFRCECVEVIDLTEFNVKFNDAIYAFSNTKLKKILGILDFSEATRVDDIFRNCNALEEIYPKASSIFLSISFATSPNLSAGSVQSIIDGLADLTGAEAQTITFHSSIVLTDEQKAMISSKNWVLEQK